jgi:hypothetical protein
MAPKFIPVWQELGADHWPESQTKMMVPSGRGRSRLVLLEDAKAGSWKAGPHVDVAAVSKDQVLHALNTYLDHLWMAKSDRENLLGALQSRVIQSLSSGGQLLSLTGKLTGQSWIAAEKEKLNLVVTDGEDYDITFKFLRCLDDDGNMSSATAKTPSDADAWIRQLRWILGAQADIWFASTDRQPLEIKKPFHGVTEAMIRQNKEFVDGIDRTADVTVYLVGKYAGERGDGQTFPDLTAKGDIVIAIDDKCTGTPVVKGDDPFIVTLAHELVHFALDKHGNKEKDQHIYNNETNILFCKRVESTVVSTSLLNKLYPPTK